MRGKKFFAWLLTAALVLGLFPVPVLAAEPKTGLCPHHTEHTADCGYSAPDEGQPCGHLHTTDCCVLGVLPDGDSGKSYEISRDTESLLNCQHEHDEQCGFVPASPGQPCGYVCPICPVQAMIDALPAGDSITANNRSDTEERLAAIDEARAGLTDEEAGQLDISRYQDAVAALSALDSQAGADVPMPADDPAEQFPALTPGTTYWFDLSSAGILGLVDAGTSGIGGIPDTTLHWVPFTYVGTVNAYKLTSPQATTEEYAEENRYDHSLFIADYIVTPAMTWSDLDSNELIFGKSYTSNGVNYIMRAPSAGRAQNGDYGTPRNNEWDIILDKGNEYIKNWDMFTWGQDSTNQEAFRAMRGYRSARYWYYYHAARWDMIMGFRPVLELPAPDTLTPGSLKVVTLDLNGGKAGTTDTAQDGPVNIVVNSGGSFTAPSGEGLTRPEGNTGSFFRWKGDDGSIYAAGTSVPASVSTLTALWEPLDLSRAAVTVSGSYFYTGEAIEPPVTVTLNGAALTAATDYTVSYENNINVGTASVTVTGTGNYTGTVNGTFTIGKAAQTAPTPGIGFAIDYAAETVTVTGSTYELAASNTAATGTGTLNVTPGVNVYIRLKETADFSPSAWTEVTIPNRPAAPAALLTLTKTADSITVTGSSGCEFSKDGISWNDSGIFTGLSAGQTYPISIRLKATNSAFASANQTVNVTTVNADGSTTVKPGESIVTGGGFTITNDGEKTTITGGGTTTTITPPSGGGNISVGAGGTVTVPGGSTVQTGTGEPVAVPEGGGVFDPSTGEMMKNVHTVTVNGGKGSGSYAAGDTVTIEAIVPSGQRFTGWTVNAGGVTLANTSSATTTFTMPAQAVTVTASFENIPAPTFLVTVNGGRGSGSYAAGDTVTIEAIVPSGQRFTGWTVNAGGVTLANTSSATTTFIMPAQAVTVTANFQNNPSNNGNSGNSWYNPPATYSVTTPAATTNGKVTVSPANAARGSTVTITVTPEDGCRLDSLSVTSGGKSVPLTEKGNGKYTFTMPAGTVKVEATFVPIEVPETPWINSFSDIAEDTWYYDAVRFVNEQGLMNGYSDGRFGPNDTLSRAQLAQILFNREGRPGVNYLLQFGDVPGEAWYTEAVRWATSQGIVGGYGNGMFGPNDAITREQLAVMLWRYSGSPAATNKELHFADADESNDYALEALRWAVENGIINGYGNGQLAPQGLATRGQVAQMLMNFLKNR